MSNYRIGSLHGSIVQVKVNLKSSKKICYFLFMAGLITIGEMARRSGVAASALRFYEERGLIQSERSGAGHRRYPQGVLRRVAFIVFAQRIGFSLDEVGVELAKLPTGRVPEGSDWAKLASLWGTRIDERIAELQRLRAGLTGCIGCGCLSLAKCKLANPGDIAGRLGSGPRYWISEARKQGRRAPASGG